MSERKRVSPRTECKQCHKSFATRYTRKRHEEKCCTKSLTNAMAGLRVSEEKSPTAEKAMNVLVQHGLMKGDRKMVRAVAQIEAASKPVRTQVTAMPGAPSWKKKKEAEVLRGFNSPVSASRSRSGEPKEDVYGLVVRVVQQWTGVATEDLEAEVESLGVFRGAKVAKKVFDVLPRTLRVPLTGFATLRCAVRPVRKEKPVTWHMDGKGEDPLVEWLSMVAKAAKVKVDTDALRSEIAMYLMPSYFVRLALRNGKELHAGDMVDDGESRANGCWYVDATGTIKAVRRDDADLGVMEDDRLVMKIADPVAFYKGSAIATVVLPDNHPKNQYGEPLGFNVMLRNAYDNPVDLDEL